MDEEPKDFDTEEQQIIQKILEAIEGLARSDAKTRKRLQEAEHIQ